MADKIVPSEAQIAEAKKLFDDAQRTANTHMQFSHSMAIEKIAQALAAAEARGAEQMRERCAQVPSEWHRQYVDAKIDFVSASKYAADAVADIRDAIRALSLEPTP